MNGWMNGSYNSFLSVWVELTLSLDCIPRWTVSSLMLCGVCQCDYRRTNVFLLLSHILCCDTARGLTSTIKHTWEFVEQFTDLMLNPISAWFFLGTFCILNSRIFVLVNLIDYEAVKPLCSPVKHLGNLRKMHRHQPLSSFSAFGYCRFSLWRFFFFFTPPV